MRGTAHQHKGLVKLVFGLQADGVFKRGTYYIGLSGQTSLHRVGTTHKVVDLYLQAFSLKKTQLIRNGQRQVVDGRLAANRNRNF